MNPATGKISFGTGGTGFGAPKTGGFGATGGFGKLGATTATTTTPTAAKPSFGAPASTSTTSATTTATTTGGATKFAFGAPKTGTTFGATATTTTATPAATATPATTSTSTTAPKIAFGAPKTGTTFGATAPTTGTAPAATATPTTTPAASSSTTTTATPATSKISFGTAKTPAFGAKPTTSVTGATATPTTSTTTTATATTSSTTTSTTTSSRPSPDVLSLLKGKTLDDIINDWTSQIENDIDSFTQVAMLVSEWDKKVSSNSSKILTLKHQVDKVYAAQGDLDKNLEMISSQQSQLYNVLGNLESQVEKWSLAMELSPQDVERERGYELAEDINVQLNQMSIKLKELIDKLNMTQEREATDHPTYQILQILDSHLNSLSWIDLTSHELGTKLDEIQASLQRRSNNMETTNHAQSIYQSYRR